MVGSRLGVVEVDLRRFGSHFSSSRSSDDSNPLDKGGRSGFWPRMAFRLPAAATYRMVFIATSN